MNQIVQVTITSAHVRCAMQSAAGRDIKFPSVEFTEYVAKFLSDCKFWTKEEPCSKSSS